MKDDYSDIIDMPHHISAEHRCMSNIDRAAQFSSFAALTGYEQAIDETARLTDKREELNDEQIEDINTKMNMLIDNIEQRPRVKITYFVPDERKSGGCYITVECCVRKIDLAYRTVTDTQNNVIRIDDIFNIVLL